MTNAMQAREDTVDVAIMTNTVPESPETTAPEMAAADVPDGPVAALLASTRELTAVLEEEIALIREAEPAAMRELQQRKAHLAAAHEMCVKALKDDPDALAALSQDERDELGAAAETLHNTLRRNARAIEAARRVTEELLSATVDIVRKHRRQNSGYAPHGGHRGPSERLSAPVTFDQSH